MMNWLLERVRRLGRQVMDGGASLGRSTLLLLAMLRHSTVLFTRPALVVAQIYNVGVLSLLIILVSGLFVGMVLGLQLYVTMVNFGAEQSLGAVIALSLLRELGPVVAALLFAGRAGSALAAEIGLMKATEQLSGMAMMAVDPVRRVLAPRMVAAIISLPLLAAIFSAVALFGGYGVAVGLLGLEESTYWNQMRNNVDLFDDVLNGVIKSIVFGVVAGWIALYQGYAATPTSEGVSRATTRTVVYTSLAVLGLDFILTALMFGDTV